MISVKHLSVDNPRWHRHRLLGILASLHPKEQNNWYRVKIVYLAPFLFLLAPLWVHASDIQLVKQLAGDALLSTPDSITVSIYTTPSASDPLVVQTYYPGDWQFSEEESARMLHITLDSPRAEQQDLWYELEADGLLIGERQVLRAPPSGVTLAAGNRLDMDGNIIINLAMRQVRLPQVENKAQQAQIASLQQELKQYRHLASLQQELNQYRHLAKEVAELKRQVALGPNLLTADNRQDQKASQPGGRKMITCSSVSITPLLTSHFIDMFSYIAD